MTSYNQVKQNAVGLGASSGTYAYMGTRPTQNLIKPNKESSDKNDVHDQDYMKPVNRHSCNHVKPNISSFKASESGYLNAEDTTTRRQMNQVRPNSASGRYNEKPKSRGTLTCYSAEFLKFSVAGTAYGRNVTEVEQASDSIKGFNFKDERLQNGNWINEAHADDIQCFFRLLAICHTAISDIDQKTGQVSYAAESPDEVAFVTAARELGFEFYNRTQTSIIVREYRPQTGGHVEREYRVLNIMKFSSSRKRMSVIIRNPEGQIFLLCKGDVMFERLGSKGRDFEDKTRAHVKEYTDAGLRTLLLAYRILTEDEYTEFDAKFTDVKNIDRESWIDAVADVIERDLILLGATFVE